MEAWGWIVVYAIGLTILQLLVYRYLLNNGGEVGYDGVVGDSDDRPDGPVAHGGERGSIGRSPRLVASPNAPANERDDQSTGRYCPHCGSENEPDHTFDRCWNCANRLV
ncbi:hypothetical protein C499_10164 [Halogeometricum borinquense DSM 11551]|uniref:DUF7577 domain-containing protein n=2 Tax=Halogeometricum borinquense TaxID=60847 RepID=E4NLI8_HALBP|nr:hypothetical protein [Halogeometricum borinquense]ADQ66084.1 hypothetical protein Hbor_04810 [Halogeometricum borinquense DSM 11551]ELY27420.1 hypothetical protein C499_10164 [Halogeometricum borinquense DSM 11551]RYJ13749.1 hypothetical protein ELS19_07080 [Halogeometricum borinquense]